ncbi:MAG: hypothetical protein WAQ25_02930 [Candidatus Saccharimonas sp.]
MKIKNLAVWPKEFHRDASHGRALGLASVYVVLAVTQLFSYEQFMAVVSAFGLPGGDGVARLVAYMLPLLEVVALPYLLSMVLPQKLWQASRLACALVPAVWLLIALWTNLTAQTMMNAGLFGATIPAINGPWLVVFTLLLASAVYLVARDLPARTKLPKAV